MRYATPSNTRAAVQYVRASSGFQACSIDDQTVANAAYAAAHDFQIIDTYSDAALSGLTLAARPALQALLKDCLAVPRAFEAVLVYDVSRWGRFQDIDEGAHYEFVCRQAGVEIHYCAEPFANDGSPESNLLKQVKRAIAAEYSRALSKRIRLAKAQVAASGFYAGGPAPIGYERIVVSTGGDLITVLKPGERKGWAQYRIALRPGSPESVRTVQRIFWLYAITGLRTAGIAELLNA